MTTTLGSADGKWKVKWRFIAARANRYRDLCLTGDLGGMQSSAFSKNKNEVLRGVQHKIGKEAYLQRTQYGIGNGA